MALVLSRSDIEKVVDMKSAIGIVCDAYVQFSAGNTITPVRSSIVVEGKGSAFFMPSYIKGKPNLGCKTVAVFPGNPAKNLPATLGTTCLLSSETGELLAILEAASLTALRTGAGSGVAMQLLASESASATGIIGAGPQGETQLEAVATVRRIAVAYAFDTNKEKLDAYCRKMSEKLGIEVKACGSSEEAVRNSDILCCATTSKTPVFNGEWLKKEVHINGIGTHAPAMRELDTYTVKNSKLFVDSREACLKEAGDVLIPISEGAITEKHIIAEIGELTEETANKFRGARTLYKSCGIGALDIAIADYAYNEALKRGAGKEISL